MAQITENAQHVLEQRYYRDNETQPHEMFRRVARCVAKAENENIRQEWEEKFFNAMDSLDFLPNSPTLMNAGTDIHQYSACFVLPIHDDMTSIFDSYKYAALVSKSGGGTGFSFSRLRPKGDRVGSTNGVASGPISWMKIQDAATEQVKQGGRRRGANMGVLRVDHPDIEEFIRCKDDGRSLQNFNLSVAVTDEFMKAVEENADFSLRFNGEVRKKVNARKLMYEIAEHAHKTGDPGIVFIDEVNRHNPTPHIGEIESTNPCGEQPLLPFEACNLGSINLANMVKGDKVDWEKLRNTVQTGVRFLDDVIDISVFPIPQIEEMVKGNRKIGLGIMGWADMLYQLNIPYDSEEGVKLAGEIASFIYKVASEYSEAIGIEKGVYPNAINDKKRNAALTTIAPTGTISFIANVSGGCEPHYALVFKRFSPSLNKEYSVVVSELEKRLKDLGLYSEELIGEIAKNRGTLSGIKGIPKSMKRVFVTAMEISPEWHVRMQAAFQTNGIDSAVSKTVNMPNSATVDDVFNTYMLAYKLKCKGVTIYRDGSKTDQVLTASGTALAETEIKQPVVRPRKRPKKAYGVTEEVTVGCGKLYITVNIDEDGLVETFINTGASGVCPGYSAATSRLISLGARCNIDNNDIIDQLCSVSCKNCKGLEVKSCSDAIGKVIRKTLAEYKAPERSTGASKKTPVKNEMLCEQCGATVLPTEGCITCMACGYSKCS